MDNYRINHMRLTGDNKEYWLNQLAEFSRRFINKNYGSRNIKGVDFGKQDIRGGFSICLIDEKNCIPKQKYFESKDQENRWCIYCNQSEASRISPEWNSWLRFISNTLPTSNNITYEWQKRFDGNTTGLDSAYKPSMIKVGRPKEDLENYHSDYKAWKPE